MVPGIFLTEEENVCGEPLGKLEQYAITSLVAFLFGLFIK
jgi:hypothetical protein